MTALWISLGVLAALLLADLLGARALIRLTLERNRAQDADPLPDGTARIFFPGMPVTASEAGAAPAKPVAPPAPAAAAAK